MFFFQAEDGIRDPLWSRGLGDVYKRQAPTLLSTVMTSRGTKDATLPSFIRCASGLLQPSGVTRPQRKESSHSLDPAVSKEVTALILLLMATVSVYCQ